MSTPTKRADQSQLDWLWDMYGMKTLTSDPAEATGDDVLTKDGMTKLVCRMIQNLVRKLDLVPNPHCDNLLDVIITQDDGDRKVAFSIEKEDHLIAVKLRKSTQADVDDNKASEVNKLVGSFRMASGKEFILDLAYLNLIGSRTDTVETAVEDNQIIANVRIAQSVQKCISVEATRNGLLIELLIGDHPGQVQLKPTNNGLVAEYKWKDGNDIRMTWLTYAEYMALLEPGSGMSGAEKQMGCIYFITDKQFFYLNGVRYGSFCVVTSNTVDVEKTEDGIHTFRVKVSGKAGNLLEAIDNGLYCNLTWSGNNKNTSFRVYRETEDLYLNLSDTAKKEAIFFCTDTHRIYINGIDYSSVDIIGTADDKNGSTLYGYINVTKEDLNQKMTDLQLQINSDMTQMSERIGVANERANKAIDTANRVQTNLDASVKRIDGNIDAIKTEQEGHKEDIEALKTGKLDVVNVEDEANPGRKAVVFGNNDVMLARKTDGSLVELVSLNKEDKVIIGNATSPLLLNGSAERPVYNGDHEVALVHDVEAEATRTNNMINQLNENVNNSNATMKEYMDNSINTINGGIRDEINRAQQKEDEILGHPGDLEKGLVSVYGNKEDIEKVRGELTDERNRAQQKEDEIIASMTANVETINETIANIGVDDIKASIDEIKQTSEETKAMAEALTENFDTLNNTAVKFNDVADAENPGRKAITLENHDIILGKDTNGGAYALAMLSKWNKADFGSASVLLNLNGSAVHPTYNDDQEFAFLSDLADYIKLDDISSDENPERKAITLKNHDCILGTGTNGSTYNLAMVSKWDKADFGSASILLNFNGSGARPTYNDDKEMALLEDIPAALPNPNALTIKYNGVQAFTYDGSAPETGNFIVNAETIPMSESDTQTIKAALEAALTRITALEEQVRVLQESI